jgi:hypothetical protein
MRRTLAFSLALFWIGLLCLTQTARSNLLTTGVGGFGGGTVAPTVLHLTAPNNFGDASWSGLNAVFQNNTSLAPDSTNTASSIQSSAATGFAAFRTTIPITMAAGTHYSLTVYILTQAVPVWAEVAIVGSAASGADIVQYWMDISSGAGAIGSTSTGGAGVIDAGFAATAAGNNYTKFVMNFHFNSGTAADNIVDLRFVDSDGGTNATLLQAYFVWGWGA